jgi:hypothetical protein
MTAAQTSSHCAVVGYCSLCDDERIHRVARLRRDEVEYLERDASNHAGCTHTDRRACCPHLSLFHSSGVRSDGAHWLTCNVPGCGCLDIGEPRRVANELEDRDADDEMRTSRAWLRGWLFGVVLGVLAGWWLL